MFEGIEFFSSLSPAERSMLEVFCQEREYKKGEILFSQGEEATAMYILKSGLLEAYSYEKVLGVIQPGDLLGEMAIFSAHKTRTASAKALEDSVVITLLSFSIHELGLKHPEILQKIKDVIEERKQKNSDS